MKKRWTPNQALIIFGVFLILGGGIPFVIPLISSKEIDFAYLLIFFMGFVLIVIGKKTKI